MHSCAKPAFFSYRLLNISSSSKKHLHFEFSWVTLTISYVSFLFKITKVLPREIFAIDSTLRSQELKLNSEL